MTALPPDFVQLMGGLLGQAEATALCASLETPSPTSIRLSQRKPLPREVLPQLGSSVSWCPWGYYLEERPLFTGQAAFHAGGYYVQEASSMLLYQVGALLGDVLGERPLLALDLCAAPGGKSTLLIDLMPAGSTLVSNEYVRERANVLAEQIQKWGCPDCLVSHTSPAKLGGLEETFDLIVVDAPCSGEGMFRKDPSARSEWSLSAVEACSQRQRSILEDIWPALKPGGLCVYSTCTFNRSENEDIVHFIASHLGATPLPLGIPLPEGVVPSPYSPHSCYRMMPHRTLGEGLFMAVLRKDGTLPPQANVAPLATSARPGRKGGKQATSSASIPEEVKGWVHTPERFVWRIEDDTISALPPEVSRLASELRSLGIPILSAGIPIGQLKGRDIIPHAALALSTELRREAFSIAELAPQDLIAYLGRETITLDESLPTGLTLVTHLGLPLGWAKHLGRRTNNLYPQHWRIRHTDRLR